MKKIKRFIYTKKSKIIFLILLDILSLVLVSMLAICLRYDFHNIPSLYTENIFDYFLIDATLLVVVFFMYKLYHSVWSCASIIELISLTYGCTTFIALQYIYKYFLKIEMPRSYYIFEVILLLFFTGAIRYAYRIAKTLRDYLKNKNDKTKIMIIGGGEAGRLLITEIYNNNNKYDFKICCIIDDDKNKIGKYIKSIQVVGNRHDIAKNCEKYDIDQIIIAMPSITKEKLSLIVNECQKTKCEIKIFGSIGDMLCKPTIKEVRPLSYEDFLGRNEIVVNIDEISSSITNQVILVTGGGGSIGSELCRQISKCNPKQLIIFDIYENNAYDIQQELIREYPNMDLQVIIGSVRDYERLENVFKTYKPDYVYHAAAHKHVPLMEYNPNEAVKNNCFGTLNTVKLADKYKVKRFILISSDKAVRPTNVMGATKRICEMIIQTYNKKSKTDYVAVRFGNVLGSNGSVIPLFLKQIENGGPVTVTHKEITRYFMTIPEAVSLILQAGVYAKGGEIFVLDMGKPVKIYDLAKKIIRFKGLEPYKDIDIKITGLRPGEKLYEELLMEEEGLKETPNKLIHIGEPIKMDDDKFLKDLDKLIIESFKNNSDIKEKVAKIVDTYKVDKNC